MNRQVRFAEGDIEHEIKVDEYSDDEPFGDEESSARKRQFNKFELLDLVEDDGGEIDAPSNEDSENDGEGPSSDIAKAKNEGEKPKHDDNANENTKPSSNKRKPRKKRGKNKANRGQNSVIDQDDELVNLAKAINQTSEPDPNQAESVKYRLLKVDTRNLVPETEIKRIFGKGVVKDDKTRPKHHPGLNLQRSRLVSSGYFEAKASGPLAGPRMELDDTINDMRIGYTTGGGRVNAGSSLFHSSEPIYFKFVHDKAYQETHRQFLKAVNQGHSEYIVQNLQINPAHAESLIQLSHMFRVSEDYKTASEFIERALVIFEKGFHPRFNLATATCRLSYKRPENRTFFITIFKHITACHRRGLRRTPFEYTKLLLSLEPDNDPLMAVQLLDFFAIRCEEYEYLIEFYSLWEQLQKLPNLSFSLALAHFLKSRNAKRSKQDNDASLKQADECLQKALLIFPDFIIPLLDACSGEPDSKLKQCSYFDYSVYSTKYKIVPETVDVLVALYVKRTFSLWKQKHVLTWLERNIADMVNRFATGQLVDEGRHTQHWSTFTKVAPKNLLRHIVLCDLDMKVPPSASSSTYIDLDPYPPTDTLHSYDVSESSSARAASGSNGGSIFDGFSGLFFRSMLPSFSLGDQNSSQPPAPPTTSSSRSGNPRNRPPQRPTNTARNRAAAAASQTVDEGSDLDYESIEYSLLIDALRDLPPLGPDSTQDTSRQGSTGAANQNDTSLQADNHPDSGGGATEDSELRRRQTRPS